MLNILCRDINGNVIEKLYQWDVGQRIVLSGLESDGSVYFHFANDPCGDMYIGAYEISGTDFIIEIPNMLLREHKPILLYVYNETDIYVANTIYMLCIPVIPRPEPEGYVFEDNSTYIKYEQLDTDIKSLTLKVDRLEVDLNALTQKYSLIAFKQTDDYLQFTADGSTWVNILDFDKIDYPVKSVNGKTGDVDITAGDVGIYVQEEEPTDAVDGDIWIDTSVNDNELDIIKNHSIVSVSSVKIDDIVTITATYSDGNAMNAKVILDENNYPISVTRDGVECALSWEGFE